MVLNQVAAYFSQILTRRRILASLFGTIMILFQFPNSTGAHPWYELAFHVVMILLFTTIFWVHTWKMPAYVGLTLLLVAMMTFDVLYFHARVNVGLMITVICYIALRFKGRLSYVLAAFVAVLMAGLVLYVHQMETRDMTTLVIGMIGYFAGARGARTYMAAYRLSQQHLAELQEAHQELQEATVRSMQYAVLEERNRIARDIHDSLGHSLTSLIVQLQALQYMIPEGPPVAREAVQNMLVVARRSLNEIRTSVHTLADDKTQQGLTPLRAFLSQVEAHTKLKCTFTADPNLAELPGSISVALFRIVQEAATNAVRHAGATSLDVVLEQAGERVRLIVRDDGSMTPESLVTPGFGLTAMRQRLEALGGSLFFAARVPHGFEVHAEVPLQTESVARA